MKCASKQPLGLRFNHCFIGLRYVRYHPAKEAQHLHLILLFMAERVIAMLQRNGSFHRQRTSSVFEGEMDNVGQCIVALHYATGVVGPGIEDPAPRKHPHPVRLHPLQGAAWTVSVMCNHRKHATEMSMVPSSGIPPSAPLERTRR